MNVPFVRRQLGARRGRALAGVAGIAAALLLVLALQAIFAGMETRLTAYIDRSGADVIVAQRGVTTMHMTSSALPASSVGRIAGVPGVAAAWGILYVPTFLERGAERRVAYLIGEQGRAEPRAGAIVVDRSFGAPVGSAVTVFGRRLRVSGTIAGTASIANIVAFANFDQLAELLGARGVVNYVLVRARPGVSAADLAARIDRLVPAVTASTRSAFAASERRVVGDMSTGIVRAMALVGLVVGVAVAALVAYSLAAGQVRELAVLRAIGLRTRGAVRVAAAQVGVLVVAGFLLALAALELLVLLLPRLSPTLALTVRAGDVARGSVLALVVALLAALVPVQRVVRTAPASAFRR